MSAQSMDVSPKILVLEPDRSCPPDRLDGWAAETGVTLEVRHPDTPAEMPASIRDYDALIVLGGEMGDGDTAAHPWLERVREALREARDHDMPTLGICLGSQLLASALGGEVRRGDDGLETGVVSVQLTESAQSDPVMAGLPEEAFFGAWHQDAITQLPEGGVLLATSGRYPTQAFRCGRSWGVQFHPEASPALYSKWVEASGTSNPAQAKQFQDDAEDVKARDAIVEPLSETLVTNFLKLVRDARATRDSGNRDSGNRNS